MNNIFCINERRLQIQQLQPSLSVLLSDWKKTKES